MNQGGILFGLWAKTEPFHPLPCHLIDVGHVTLALLETPPYRPVVQRFHHATGIPVADVPAWLAYLTALHDIGKCHPEFQAKGPAELLSPLEAAGLPLLRLDERFRHEAASARWLMDHLCDERKWPRRSAETVAGAIRGHHGNFAAEAQEGPPGNARWEPLRADLEHLVRDTFAPPEWSGLFQDHSAAGLLVVGLTVLSDWIASNPDLFPFTYAGESVGDYITRSRARATKAVSRLGFAVEPVRGGAQRFAEVFPHFKEVNPLQAACERLVLAGARPGLTFIEELMGGGKTEAALYLAIQWQRVAGLLGLYVALPTAATSNQMFERVERFLMQLSHEEQRPALDARYSRVRLIHGMAWLMDEEAPESLPVIQDEADQADAESLALDWFRPLKRSFLSLYGVGTVDQANLSVLHVKHGFLRLFGLAGKVLIIDEVHSYDRYISQILTRLLRWCRHLAIPVILLSATLPESRKAELIQAYSPSATLPPRWTGAEVAYPLITHVATNGSVQEVAVSGKLKLAVSSNSRGREIHLAVRRHPGFLGDPEAVAELVAGRLEQPGCLCVIANTVDSAQKIYAAVQRRVAGREHAVTLQLFHARFPANDRIRIEEEVLQLFDKRSLLPKGEAERTDRPERGVLVATQVVEQSLDLDFDELYTEVAPIDLLLQRGGRIHRHERENRPGSPIPIMHLLLPPEGDVEFGSTGTVYHPYILMRTLNVIPEETVWLLPQQVRSLVERVYGQEPDDLLKQVPADLVAAARTAWAKELQGEEDQAKRYLIPVPTERSFALLQRRDSLFDENEGEAATYFAVRTRLGDHTQRVLLIDGEEWASDLDRRRPPRRERLRTIYLRTVNLPRWWFHAAQPEPGYEPVRSAPPWLPGTTFLRLREGRWRGRDQHGRTFVIRPDSTYGVLRESEEG